MGIQLTLIQTQVVYIFPFYFLYLPQDHINLALAYHNLQLEAAAFREEFDPEAFEDLTLPNYRAIHEVKPTMGVFAIISLMIN